MHKKKLFYLLENSFIQKTERTLRTIWYMCLKTEICCLKIFMKIRVGEKMCGNT